MRKRNYKMFTFFDAYRNSDLQKLGINMFLIMWGLQKSFSCSCILMFLSTMSNCLRVFKTPFILVFSATFWQFFVENLILKYLYVTIIWLNFNRHRNAYKANILLLLLSSLVRYSLRWGFVNQVTCIYK